MTALFTLALSLSSAQAQDAFSVAYARVVIDGTSSGTQVPDAIDIGFTAPTPDSVQVVATVRKITHGLTLKRGVMGFEDGLDWWAACVADRCPEILWTSDGQSVVYGQARAGSDNEWRYVPVRRFYTP